MKKREIKNVLSLLFVRINYVYPPLRHKKHTITISMIFYRKYIYHYASNTKNIPSRFTLQNLYKIKKVIP